MSTTRMAHLVQSAVYYVASTVVFSVGIWQAWHARRFDVATFWLALAICFDRYGGWHKRSATEAS